MDVGILYLLIILFWIVLGIIAYHILCKKYSDTTDLEDEIFKTSHTVEHMKKYIKDLDIYYITIISYEIVGYAHEQYKRVSTFKDYDKHCAELKNVFKKLNDDGCLILRWSTCTSELEK